MNDYTMYAEDVYYVDVADASIFPAAGKVVINQGGQIETLENAEIITNRSTKNHHIRDAVVDIYSKNYYEAQGTYQYIDVENVIREIELSEIRVDSLGRTIGQGYINENKNFYLNPHFKFTGSVNLIARESYLNFEGGFKIVQDCYTPDEEHWVYFNAFVDPQNVILPVEEPLIDIDSIEIDAAVYVSKIYENVYPVLFSRRKVLNDTAMVSARGVVTYDTSMQSFIIGPRHTSTSGQQLIFDTRKCVVRAKGPINTGVDLDYVGLQTAGTMDYLAIPDSTLLNISIALDFYFDQNALKMMADSLVASNLPGLDLSNEAFYDMLGSMMSAERLEAYKSDLALFGVVRRLPEELVHTLFFTDVNMYWNPVTRSYLSKGPIGINNIETHLVNRYVNGNIELIKKRSGDELNIYLELNDRTWYFFNYRTFIMQSVSSDMEYNARIADIKPDKRILRDDNRVEQYEYVISTRRKRIDFLRRMDEYNK